MSDALDRLARIRRGVQVVSGLSHLPRQTARLLARIDEELDLLEVDIMHAEFLMKPEEPKR